MTDFVEELVGLIRGRGTVAMTDRGPVQLVPTHTILRRCGWTAAVMESQRQLRALGCAPVSVEVGPRSTLIRGERGDDVLQIFHANDAIVPLKRAPISSG